MKNESLFDMLTHIAYDRYVGKAKVDEMIHRAKHTQDVDHVVVSSKPLDPEGDFVRDELKGNFKPVK